MVHGQIFRNSSLVRALLSFGAAYTAEWAFTVAISLVAFADGGAIAVGLVGMLRLLPSALLAPVVTAYADRLPREKVLFASSAVRGLATLLCAPILVADGPTWVVYVLAIVSTIAFTPYRASHSALMPLLCRTPAELTSINVVRGLLDSLSVVIGPFVAAVLVAVSDVASVFVFAGACGIVSAFLVVGLRYERVARLPSERRLLGEIREGVQAVSDSDGVWFLYFFVVLQCFLRGAFTVFVVVVAIDLLERGESDVGVLQGAVGVGALVGSVACTLLVGSRAMTRWLSISVVLWGAPMALMGLLPEYVVALFAAAVIGIGQRGGRRHDVHPRREDGAGRRACAGLRRAREPGRAGSRPRLARCPAAGRDPWRAHGSDRRGPARSRSRAWGPGGGRPPWTARSRCART